MKPKKLSVFGKTLPRAIRHTSERGSSTQPEMVIFSEAWHALNRVIHELLEEQLGIEQKDPETAIRLDLVRRVIAQEFNEGKNHDTPSKYVRDIADLMATIESLQNKNPRRVPKLLDVSHFFSAVYSEVKGD